MVAVAHIHDWFRRDVRDRLEATAGGPARLRVILLLAGVLGLSTADAATVGSVAAELERALGLSNSDVGLLVTVSVGVGALATLPVGVLTDRVSRTRLLWISIALWALAVLASAAAVSFPMLLLTRLALGVVVATAYPATASLVGDLFAPAERGRIYGYILTGELVGTGVGFLVSGDLAGVLSWRAGFAWLALPSLALAWAIRRYLPEPARGGQSRLRIGATRIVPASEIPETGGGAEATEDPETDGVPDTSGTSETSGEPETGGEPEASGYSGARGDPDRAGDGGTEAEDGEVTVEQEIEAEQLPPHERLVLREDPTERSLWWAVRFTLSIRTNLILIVASGLGYFFLQGMETFAVVYLRGRYGLSQAVASSLLVVLGLGAILGVLVAGRLSDELIHHRHIAGRPVAAGISFLAAAALFVPALLASSLAAAAPLLFFAAAALGGTNPPLNAARLDLVYSRLWGRAESVRTALATVLQAIAPLTFGYVSILFGGQDTGIAAGTGSGPAGLEQTFLIMLAPLLLAGVLLVVRASRTYPRDVASAIASEHALEALPR